MGDLTPFQNQVLDYAEMKEAEEKKKKREEMREQEGPSSNSRSSGSIGGSDMGSEETVRYVNKQENPDHEVHD